MKKERKVIIAGNWKMNKTVAEALDLVREPDVDGASLDARSFADIIKKFNLRKKRTLETAEQAHILASVTKTRWVSGDQTVRRRAWE